MNFADIADRSNGETIVASWFQDIENAGKNVDINMFTKSADYTVDAFETAFLLDGSSNTVDLSLFSAIDNKNKTVRVKAINIDNTVRILTVGSETIDGSLFFTFTVENEVIELISDGSDWQIFSGGGTSGSSGSDLIGKREIPTGLVNGLNNTFTITKLPIDETIQVLKNGIVTPIDQYAFSHPTITFVTAPAIGSKVEVQYLTDGTSATVQLEGTNRIVESRVVTLAEETAKQLTLIGSPIVPGEVIVDIRGSAAQIFGLDYTVSGQILNWSGFALDGVLLSGDTIRVDYFE